MVLRLYAGESEKLEKILLQEGAQKKGGNLVINGVTLSLYKRKLDHKCRRPCFGTIHCGFFNSYKAPWWI